jgi:hypothetical protein
MTEMDMWNLLAGFMSGNAVWFLGYIVAIWLGFRNDQQYLYDWRRSVDR